MTEPRRGPVGPDGPPPWDHDGPSGTSPGWDRYDEIDDGGDRAARVAVNLGEVERLVCRLLCYLLWLAGALFGAYALATGSMWPAMGCLLLMFAGGAPAVVLWRAEHRLRAARQAAELERAKHEPRRVTPPPGSVSGYDTP